jgi:hypothetical protein
MVAPVAAVDHQPVRRRCAMNVEKLFAVARPLVLSAAFVLFVDLFLDWRAAFVTTPEVTVSAGRSGLAGWGIVAGVLLAALIVWELRLRVRGSEELRDAATATVLALGAAGFAVVSFFTGSANVDVGGVVVVNTEELEWAAYLGLALAGVLAVAALVRYAAEARLHPTASRHSLHGAT